MGASSSKRTFFWQKKKSPVERAWGRLKGALPNKKSKRKRLLEKLKPGNSEENKFKKRFSLTDKKEPKLFKRFSLGNMKKDVRGSGGKEEESKGSRRQSKCKENSEKWRSAFQSEGVASTGCKKDKSKSKRPQLIWMSK